MEPSDDGQPADVHGDGSRERPFSTISQGVQRGTIVYVAESEAPYVESVTLKKGQMLIGSAFGLDAVRHRTASAGTLDAQLRCERSEDIAQCRLERRPGDPSSRS